MCGIIGYVGKKPAKDILIDGLAKLEYRGYDSAGIALLNDDDTLTIKKKAGRVEDLREMCSDDSPVYRSTCGIAFSEKRLTSRPSSQTWPSSQLSMPPRMFSKVVLPAPEGPTMMQNSPLST